MKKQDLIEAIPLAILTIIGIYSIIEVISTEYIFGIKQHIGLTLLGTSIIFFFVNRRYYRYIFGITIILGLVTLIGFSTTIRIVTFLGISIQILLLPIVAIFVWINKEKIKSKNLDVFGKQAEAKFGNSSKVNGFKRRFGKLSNSEIESKLEEGLVPEAIEALKQLKKEREKTF